MILASFNVECNSFRKKNMHRNLASEKEDLLNSINMNNEKIEHLKTGIYIKNAFIAYKLCLPAHSRL
jgi:hypothetical protein